MYDELIKNLRHDSASALQNCEFDFVHDWMLKAADAIEELQTQLDNSEIGNIKLKEEFAKYRGKNRWIPVTERLPENYERVLTCDDHKNIHIMSHFKGYEYPFGINPEHPRYFMPKWWMPLPQPPESEE